MQDGVKEKRRKIRENISSIHRRKNGENISSIHISGNMHFGVGDIIVAGRDIPVVVTSKSISIKLSLQTFLGVLLF